MRDVAIVSFAQCNAAREDRNEVEILLPVVKQAVAASKVERAEIDFTCSGSSDFLQGQPVELQKKQVRRGIDEALGAV